MLVRSIQPYTLPSEVLPHVDLILGISDFPPGRMNLHPNDVKGN